jgi:hypothetical protein
MLPTTPPAGRPAALLPLLPSPLLPSLPALGAAAALTRQDARSRETTDGIDRLLHLLLVIPAGCATKLAAAPARLQQLDWLQLWPRGEAAGQIIAI